MEMKFCRRCGEKLVKDGEAYTCANQHIVFTNPAPTVGVFLLQPELNAILFSRRGIEPRKGELDTFGGFVEDGENFETAASREIEEETGLVVDDYSPLEFLCSAAGTYPYNGETRQVLSVFFVTTLKTGKTPVAKDDVGEVVSLTVDTIDEDAITAEDVKASIPYLRNYVRGRKKSIL